ncbi:tectonin beta-propeller repeat-containing protein 2 isoform X1 [Hemiscyllium ocellatum]|uniref:tectonin beta-propeller repeat-containing protein 2 isoform X1 n=1 Tax=Hemiscyllium ocellatum TaxID=170820 RepID=UPI00296695B1|nr:tectonin beta-propeller repeat-containing protein 2 isoform X1 [Hemiscyllium ocellatum]
MALDVHFTTFKEFSPLSYLLNAIPTKVQKGFRNVLVHLTALDSNNDYIAVGSDIGMLYLYCRRLNKMTKYNLEGKTDTIRVVKLLACFDDLVAVGTSSGRVVVFQLVSPLPGRNKQLRRFDVGIHKSNITALAWSTNGMKLFSGDDQGKVVYAAVDLDQGVCRPRVILEESSPIVQLDYTQKVLLVSTYLHSVLIYTEQNIIKQVGTQPRKSAGRFGACFLPGLCKQTNVNLYASRPGLRLWKSDVQGVVQSTLLLKSVFTCGVKPFELLPRASFSPANKAATKPAERNFGLLKCFLHDGWVLSWNKTSIYVLDAVNQALIGGLEGLSGIVSVSCTDDEIFMLTDYRDIIRISNKPECFKLMGVHSQLNSPLTVSSRESVQETVIATDSKEMRSENKTSETDRFEAHHSSSSELEPNLSSKNEMERHPWDETGEGRHSETSEPRSRSSSTNSGISVFSHVTSPEQQIGAISLPVGLTKISDSAERFRTLNMEEFNQQLIVVPVKKKKKRKQASSGSEGSFVKHEIDCSNSSQSSEPALLSDFAFEGSITTTCDLSDQMSLLSSSLDHLITDFSEQESHIGTELDTFLQEECNSNIFGSIQPPECTSTSQDGHLPSDNLAESLKTATTMNENTSSSDLHFAECLDTVSSVKLETLDSSCNKNKDCRGEVSVSSSEPVLRQQANSVSTMFDVVCNSEPLELRSQDPEKSVLSGGLNLQGSLSESSESFLDERHALLMRILSPDKDHNRQEINAFSQLCVSYNEPNLSDRTESPQPFETVCSVDNAITDEKKVQQQLSSSSDDEDIYGHGGPPSLSEPSVTEHILTSDAEKSQGSVFQDLNTSVSDEMELLKSDQFAESWMGYSGPGYNILSLVVSEKHVWCLDYKGGLYCSPFHGTSLRWQKFEDGVQQVAVSPSGVLLWKIEQKSSKAFACGKVTMKGKRHWYEALPNAAYVALSDDTAWIIQTNGELYLQTGLSADRPCARAVKVECPCPLVQITSRNNVVWALTEQRTTLFRNGISSFCPEGEHWISDIVSEKQMLELVCIALGDQQTVWALDTNGNLWFRTGISSKKPQGEDEHWWQVSVTDYVVFDQCNIFQTIIHATHTVATVAHAPVEKVADKLRGALWSQQPPSQPSLISVNSSGVWITSGKNELHVAKGNLLATYWKTIVPRGTVSATKWAFVLASMAPTKKGSFLWLGQSNKDLFCISDQNPEFRPSTVQLPPDVEMVQISASHDAVWGLDLQGNIHIRTLSENCPSGMHWTKLDLTQLGSIKLSSLACGGQHVWACDVDGIIYFRVGTQPLNPSMMLPAWITIEPPEQINFIQSNCCKVNEDCDLKLNRPLGTQLINIYSSPNDQMVWAVDSRGNVHVRLGITEAMPVGTDWEHVPGLQASQLTVSYRTVWVRCSNGDIARRYGITNKNPAGDYWKKIPGNVICLTVTPQDDLWAISTGGSLLQRLTKNFNHTDALINPNRIALLGQSEDFDDEWEVI